MKILFQPDGSAVTIYSEVIDLSNMGRLRHQRASHVEPAENGKWTADLKAVGGPVFGPFEKRSDALRAEKAWLNKNLEGLTI